MSAVELLRECQARQIVLESRSGQLDIDAPACELTDDLLKALRTHKEQLLQLLDNRQEADTAACEDGGSHNWVDSHESDGKTRRFCSRCCQFAGFVQNDGTLLNPPPSTGTNRNNDPHEWFERETADGWILERDDALGMESIELPEPYPKCRGVEPWQNLAVE